MNLHDISLEDLRQDVRQGFRALRREWGFSLIAITAMALGIGSTVTLFGVADGVLLRPLPWSEPDRLVHIEERRGGLRGRVPWTMTNGTYEAWTQDATTLDGIGGWMTAGRTLGEGSTPERLMVTAATPSLFTILRARVAIGRLFTEEDAETGRSGTAILSFGLWQQRFGGDPTVLGRTIRLDERDYEVVGVMPRGFAFPDRDTRVWVPLRVLPLMSADGRQMRVIVVGALARLRDGVTPQQAADEATGRARGVPDIRQAALSVFGSRGEVSIAVAPVREVLTAEVRPAIVLLLCAVALLLLASIANVVSVQLARATARRHDAAIQLAMGAGRWRLTRRWLTESALLGVCAGLLGVTLAAVLCKALPALLPPDFPRVDDIRLDFRSVSFALLVSIISSIACGTVPALLAMRTSMAGALSETGIPPISRAARTGAAQIRTAIVIGQVAVACILLIGSALLARSFLAMANADRGYDATNLLTARATFPHQESRVARRIQTLELLGERLRGVPGVTHAAFGSSVPLVGAGSPFGRSMPSPRDPTNTIQVTATRRVMSPEYFSALQLRLVEGRLLSDTDTASTPAVVVVNRSFAAEYVGSQPVGQRLQLGLASRPEWEIIGVVDDVRQGDISEPTRPEFFVSYRQFPDGLPFDPILLVKTNGDPTQHVGTLRSLASALDSSLVLDSIVTMEDRVVTSLARPRVYALVLGALATLALAIAAVGIFGVLLYTTARRTSEFGVRLAVGAEPSAIVRLVIRQAFAMIGVGIVVGIAVTLAAAESLARILYGITTRDATSYALAPVLIVVVGLAACIVPARRAARIDPVKALHSR